MSRFAEIAKSLTKDTIHFTDPSLTVFIGEHGHPHDCIGSFSRIDATHVGFTGHGLEFLEDQMRLNDLIKDNEHLEAVTLKRLPGEREIYRAVRFRIIAYMGHL